MVGWLYTFIGGGIVVLIIRAIKDRLQRSETVYPIHNENVVDICIQSYDFNYRNLSNWAAYEFEFDGFICPSMETLLQAMKFSDPEKQIEVLRMSNEAAAQEAIRSGMEKRWKKDGLLYWKGQAYQRNGAEYHELLQRAYVSKLECNNNRLMDALNRTKGMSFSSSNGMSVGQEKRLIITCSELPKNPTEAVITEQEFCEILTSIRDTPR